MIQKGTLYIWLTSLTLFFLLSGCGDKAIRPSKVVSHKGDQQEWKNVKVDEQHWENTNGSAQKGIFWLRFHIQLPIGNADGQPWGLQIVSLGSYDAFWDGHFITRNGKVGRSKPEEIPGKHSRILILPDSSSKRGNHILALRLSNFYSLKSYDFVNIWADSYERLIAAPKERAVGMGMLAGAFLIGFMYYLIIFFHHRDESLFLVFSLISFLFFALICLEYLPVFWNYPYPVQIWRLEAIGVLTLSVSFAIPYFLNAQFKVIKPSWFSIALGIILLTVFFFFHGRYDYVARVMSIIMGITSLLIAIAGIHRKTNGAIVVLLALLLGAIASGLWYFDYSLYLSFGFLMIAMLYLLIRRSKAIDKAYRQSLLLSERLKMETLKKSIQPHFLMNTLTTLMDWVEESPQSGVKMIKAIANELGQLSRMSEQQMVPITEEVMLCQYHIQVMGFRKQIDYRWETSGIADEEFLPPAIIHTALENGITHSKPMSDGTIRFHLEYKKEPGLKIYTLYTHATNRSNTRPQKTGTGLQYIKARLQESYGSKWELKSESWKKGWVTTIKLIE